MAVAIDAHVKVCAVVVVSAAGEIVFSIRTEEQDLLIRSDVRIDFGVAAVDFRPELLGQLVFAVR